MWFLVSLAAAIIASAAYILLKKERQRFKLGFLALMLWGVAIMVFVDHGIAYLEGEPFMSAETDGLVADSALLGLLMVAAVVAVWLVAIWMAGLQKERPAGSQF